MGFDKLDHLRDCFSRQNWKQVGNQQELVSFVINWCSWFELAECDALTFIGTSSTSVNKWRVEAMYVKMFIVDEETLTNCAVSISISIHIEP
jgi:hypothetical protein